MWFDILIILLLIAGTALGWRRGFMAQIGAFVGVVLGIICCQIFAAELGAKFSASADTPGSLLLANVMAYVIIFLACFLLGKLVGRFIVGAARLLHLGALDRLAGAIFKIAEYLLCLSILLNLWIAVFPDTKLRSAHTGLTQSVVDFAPTVLGSKTVKDIFAGIDNAAASTKNRLEKATGDN